MIPMLSTILPSGVAVAEARGELPRGIVFPEEAPAIARAVAKRRLEFEAGRALARQALQQLGYPSLAIVSGTSREPIWPKGIVGSITHCEGYCAAAVARADAVATIGIDAAPQAPLGEGVLRLIARDEERAWMEDQVDADLWARLLFSAKESVFKAWFPLTRRWIDFSAASVRFDPVDRTFRATLITATSSRTSAMSSTNVASGSVSSPSRVTTSSPSDERA
jgi:4'-phosphopantetheinyl transferase EntD